MKTGDVIVAFDGEKVRSGRQLVPSDDVSIGIVRDKKESTLKATLPATRRGSRGRV